MKYPKKLMQRANEMLSARRQEAYLKQAEALQWLVDNHLDIAQEKQKIRVLSAQRGMAAIRGSENASRIDEELQKAKVNLDSLMAEAGITEDDLEPAFTCPKCCDRGIADGTICNCKQTILNQLVYEQLCDVSPVQECSFENFSLAYYDRADQPVMGKVLCSCQRYVREFGKKSKNLLFHGAPGLGKTHLSLAIAEGVAKSGWLVMYVSAPHLMDELERGKFQKDTDSLEYREIIFGCDLLVIDDLGTELVTRYTQAEIYDLVNTRLNTSCPTIINTNLSMGEIEKNYTSRVASRIGGMYAPVQFRGQDIRFQKRKERRL